jgi:hypothetical protein
MTERTTTGLSSVLDELGALKEQLSLPSTPANSAADPVPPDQVLDPAPPPRNDEPERTKYVYGAAGLSAGLLAALLSRWVA